MTLARSLVTSVKMTVLFLPVVFLPSPATPVYKISNLLLVEGGVVGLWTGVCHSPYYPDIQMPASEIKQTFLSTKLACILAFELWAAGGPPAPNTFQFH